MCCNNVKKLTRSWTIIERTESNLFKEVFVAMLPAYFDDGSYVPLYTITGGVIMLCYVRVEIFTDIKEIVLVGKTKFCPVYKISKTSVGSTNSK